MIEIKDWAFPSTKQWEIVVHGIRNPYSSWDKSDSVRCVGFNRKDMNLDCKKCTMGECDDPYVYGGLVIGDKDLKLAKNLINSGVEHAKFLRQLPVILDINAPLYWWKQMDQYKIGTTTDACSSMHTLTKKAFKLEDFSFEHFENIDKIETESEGGIEMFYGKGCGKTYLEHYVIPVLNNFRTNYLEKKNKNIWYALNELLPQSYNQIRTWSGSYANLFNICAQRAGHKLPEWNDFIKWIVNEVPYFRELCFDKLCQISKPFKELFDEG